MSRLAPFFILIFAFNLIDFPVSLKASAKCCCSGAAFCHCRHAGGLCPLKQKGVQQNKKPLKAFEAEKAAPDKASGDNRAVLRLFGCGSKEESSFSPAYSKDFCINAPSENFRWERPGLIFRRPLERFCFFLDLRIDQPPRIS